MASRVPVIAALVLSACASSPAHDDGRVMFQTPRPAIVPLGALTDGAAPTPTLGPAGKIDTPTREGVPLAGSELVHGRSTVVIDAPIAAVRRVVLDFDRYAEFMPHYKQSRVLASRPDGSQELYMQIAALHGALKMWARVEMPPQRVEGDVEIYESRFLDGNVRDFQAIWRLRPAGERRTELSLEVFLQPKLPMPASLLNEENLDGAVKGITAMRERILAGVR